MVATAGIAAATVTPAHAGWNYLIEADASYAWAGAEFTLSADKTDLTDIVIRHQDHDTDNSKSSNQLQWQYTNGTWGHGTTRYVSDGRDGYWTTQLNGSKKLKKVCIVVSNTINSAANVSDCQTV
jgi:hypothetical protein